KLTHGQITGINATVTVCYEVFFGFCIKAARFVDQLVIEPGTFSGGGDSGSLIVTDDGNKNPVALLFAGSSTQTIANRIDLVLNQFGVTVDGGNSPPPTPVTDDNADNNHASTTVTVNGASSVIHIGDLDGYPSRNGSNWSVTVEITVHDANHNPLNGATVVGHWSQLGMNSNTCTTGDLGGNGTCTVLF